MMKKSKLFTGFLSSLLLLVSLGCKHRAKTPDLVEDTLSRKVHQGGKPLDFPIAFCNQCRLEDEFVEFEKYLGSREIEIPLEKLARSFLGTNSFMEGTTKLFPATPPFLLGINTSLYQNRLFVRPRSNDTLPNTAVLIWMYNYRGEEMDFEVASFIVKVFYEDEILAPYLTLGDYRPDSNEFKALVSGLQQNLTANFGNQTHDFSVGNKKPFFDVRVFREKESAIYDSSGSWKDFSVCLPPLLDFGRSSYWTPVHGIGNDTVPNWIRKQGPAKYLTVVMHVGWASPWRHYLEKSNTKEECEYRLSVGPEDWAIYIIQTLNHYHPPLPEENSNAEDE